MIFGVQYYRPPFPRQIYWEEDFVKIKSSGFDTIQFWVHWGWVEPEPGRFLFDDYDTLLALADKNGLRVVLSLSAELQPYWIHRAVPGSEMVDHMGSKVVSSNRHEAHQGLTPGGCIDNPIVLKFMKRFLTAVAGRYSRHPALAGWDCWNELRWCINSDSLVCYCDYTKMAFRQWLSDKYGSLDGLNRAWERRYGCWEDVEPGKLPHRPYTEIMAFEAFQQEKLARHLKFRVDTIRGMDKDHTVSAHDGGPVSLYSWGGLGNYGSGGFMLHALHSGNPFDMAEQVDVFGTSHYPGSQTATLAEFGAGIELTRSANPDGRFWISELQGHSRDLQRLNKWYWSCFARGAKAVLAWAWRDEVFGPESGGNGIIKHNDETNEARLDVFRKIGAVLHLNSELIDGYIPDKPAVGLYHDANAYNLEWAASAEATETATSLKGWSKALERAHIPYSFIDSGHIKALDGIRLLIMAQPQVIPDMAAGQIIRFVHEGGTLLIEGDADAFTPEGFYRYAGAERGFAAELGIDYAPARDIVSKEPWCQLLDVNTQEKKPAIQKGLALQYNGTEYDLLCENYITPIIIGDGADITPIGRDADGNVLATMRAYDKGSVIALGGFLGKAYHRSNYAQFEEFLSAISADVGALPGILVTGSRDIYLHTGMSGGKRLVFLINDGNESQIIIQIAQSLLPSITPVTEIVTNVSYKLARTANGLAITVTACAGQAYCFVIG